MKKPILISLIAVFLIGAGIGAYFMVGHKKTTVKPKVWNQYSYTNRFMKTLTEDFLMSTTEGSADVKMKVTLEFPNSDDQKKFLGLDSPTGAAPAANGTDPVISPLEEITNSEIGDLMLKEPQDRIQDKSLIEQDIRDYLNNNLNMGKNFVSNVYIDNYIIQYN